MLTTSPSRRPVSSGASVTKTTAVPAGSTCWRGDSAVAQAAVTRRKAAPTTAVRRMPSIRLAGFLLCLGGFRRCLLALLDQSFDLLAALLTDRLVELRAVAVASRLAALLAALLADGLVEGVAMGLLGRLTALAPDHLVELGPVLFLDGLAAFLAGFADGHAASGLAFWGGHEWG